MFEWFKTLLFGKPRDIEDPHIFHRLSLIAFLAWVGLGADGLSSSTYGPEETFRMLGVHTHLAPILALAMIITIAVISYAYSKVIEHFPYGGGGYVIATSVLGSKAGLVSGSALLVDYILTISVSIAAATDAFFSFLPIEYQMYKFPAALVAIVGLTMLNLRGVRESVEILMPVFLIFLITHAVLILGAIFLNAGNMPQVVHDIHSGFREDMTTIGMGGILAVCLRAYAFGCGTYTGIEAVSNGLAIMREPKVETGKKTMLYMAVSLAVTASGLVLAYLLLNIRPVEGRTMNAALTQGFVDAILGPDSHWGWGFLMTTLAAEALLLVVAAQAGFIDGPRVMANMAIDSWLPRRLASLSERLTIQDGILLMSIASVGTLLYARGHTTTLVTMYSINVFITFTLTEMSMIRFWLRDRTKRPDWQKKIAIHVTGFILCSLILVINLYEKFFEGGWVTVAMTLSLIGICALIRRHYHLIMGNLSRLDEIVSALPSASTSDTRPLDPRAFTAVLLVGGYGGLGIHALLSIQRLFPNHFKNFVFVSIGVIDAAKFKGVREVDELRKRTEGDLKRYVDLAHRLGLAADYRLSMGTEVMDEAEQLCGALAREYPRSIFFASKLVFQKEQWFQRLLHNETAYALQRRLQFSGLNAMVLPVRILTEAPA